MTFKKPIKIIATMLVVAFTITFGLSTQQLAQAMQQEQQEQTVQSQKEALAKSYEKPTTQTKLGSFADELYKWYETLKADIDANDLTKLQTDQKSAVEALKSLRSEIDTEFSNNEQILEKLNAKNAQQRQEEFKAQINSKLDSFEALFQSLGTASTKKLKSSALKSSANSTANTANDLKKKIQEIGKALKPEQQEQPLGALPHNNVSVNPPSPATGSESSAAYISTTSGAITSDLPKVPTTEDLAETSEVAFTQDIKALADSLNTSVKIYEYVKNNINFEPYYGSRKGSTGTLRQMSGNDYDQASLLIAMLRYKGIPSRYVTGTVEIPIKKAQAWVGAETPEAAVKVIGSMGIPSVAMVSGGVISAVRIEHVWVEAYVPYENYRGIGKGTGKKIWVPLDASFKQYTNVKGLDIKAITGVTDEQAINAFKTDAKKSSDGDAITSIKTDKMSSFLDTTTQKLQQYIKDNNLKDSSAQQLTGGKKIIPQNLGLLPLTLQYKTVAVTSESNTVPESSSEKIGFSIKGSDPYNLNFGGENDFNIGLKAVELYGKRITLMWVPATAEDAAIINSYGGIFKTPAYMIQLKPQLKADGKVIAEGKAAGFGYRQQFTIAMGHVGQAVENVTNPVTVGGIYSIAFDYGEIDIKELDTVKERLAAVKDKATQADIYTDEVLGEILNSVGKAYFGQLDGYNSIIAKAMNVSSVRQVSEGMTGYKPTVKYIFNTPAEVSGGSFFIDVDHDVVGVKSLDGKDKNEIAYMMNTGVIGSAMEHGIYEQVFQLPSVSTIKILTEASSRGIPVYTISKNNIAKLSELNVSSSVKTDITNAVNSGKTVTIPQKEIRYYNWQGSGYVVMNPETGAAAYMISGGLAGGSAAIDVMVTLAGLATLIWAIYDTIAIAGAFLAAVSPIAAFLYYTLFAVSLISVFMTLNDIILYWETGDYKYASQLMGDLILNLATFGVFKVLDAVLPDILKLFKNVKGQMDTAAEIASKYGDEAGEIVSRYGPDAVDAVNKYGDDAVKAIRNYGDDGLQVIKKYGDDALKIVNKYGDDAVTAMKNGIEPDLISKLDELGVKPEDLLKNNIVNREAAEKIVGAAETAVSKAKAVGIADESQLKRISENAAEAMSKGSKFTEPTLKDGGLPKGKYEEPDINDPRPITRQNEAADLLANKGYDIEMLPYKKDGNGYGLTPGSNPDYMINGEVFDCYAPDTSAVRNIWRNVQLKTESQAKRIILNLDDYTGSMDDLAKQFNDWDIEGLSELIAVKNGQISRIIIK